jgi:hypothetical protein
MSVNEGGFPMIRPTAGFLTLLALGLVLFCAPLQAGDPDLPSGGSNGTTDDYSGGSMACQKAYEAGGHSTFWNTWCWFESIVDWL